MPSDPRLLNHPAIKAEAERLARETWEIQRRRAGLPFGDRAWMDAGKRSPVREQAEGAIPGITRWWWGRLRDDPDALLTAALEVLGG